MTRDNLTARTVTACQVTRSQPVTTSLRLCFSSLACNALGIIVTDVWHQVQVLCNVFISERLLSILFIVLFGDIFICFLTYIFISYYLTDYLMVCYRCHQHITGGRNGVRCGMRGHLGVGWKGLAQVILVTCTVLNWRCSLLHL